VSWQQILMGALALALLGGVLVLVSAVGAGRVHARYVKLRGRDYGRPMFRPGRVYLITVRRPTPSLILRRSTAFGYVGQTRNGDFMVRINQHLHGYRDEPAKWWAGDVVRVRCVYSSQRVTTWGLDFREWLFIKVTFPLHNYLMNTRNPRRVTPPAHVLDELALRKATRAQQQQRPGPSGRPGGRSPRGSRPVGPAGRGRTGGRVPAPRRRPEW
jgi:hypothetical protein